MSDFRISVARAARADRVVAELSSEHVPVHGSGSIVERILETHPRTDLRALPRHDHERLRRVLIAENRDSRHLLVFGLRLLARIRLRSTFGLSSAFGFSSAFGLSSASATDAGDATSNNSGHVFFIPPLP